MDRFAELLVVLAVVPSDGVLPDARMPDNKLVPLVVLDTDVGIKFLVLQSPEPCPARVVYDRAMLSAPPHF